MQTDLKTVLSELVTASFLRALVSLSERFAAVASEFQRETEFEPRAEVHHRAMVSLLEQLWYLFPPEFLSACRREKQLAALAEAVQNAEGELLAVLRRLESVHSGSTGAAQQAFASSAGGLRLAHEQLSQSLESLRSVYDELSESLELLIAEHKSEPEEATSPPIGSDTGVVAAVRREPDAFLLHQSAPPPFDLERLGVQNSVTPRNDTQRLPDRFPGE